MGDAARNDNDRLERLIASNEASANALTRLVQLLEGKERGKRARANNKQRRTVVDKPITVTPLVEAAARRALARVRGR